MFTGHTGTVNCGEWTHDGRLILTSGEDGLTKIWSPKTGECIHTWRGNLWHQNPIHSMKISKNDEIVITGDRGGFIKMGQIKTQKILGGMKGAKNPIVISEWEQQYQQEYDQQCSIETITFSKLQPWFATGSLDGTIRIFDLKTQKSRQDIFCESGIIKLLWHPEKPEIFACCVDSSVVQFDSRTCKIINKFNDHKVMVLDMQLDTQKNLLYTSDDLGNIYSFNV